MNIEFTPNELHTIAGCIYPYLDPSSEYTRDTVEDRQEVILHIARALLNEEYAVDLNEDECWDIRNFVHYTAMIGAESTGRGVHSKLWSALLQARGYTQLRYGDISDKSYADSTAHTDTRS